MSEVFEDLWLEFLCGGLCGLCGQTGWVNTMNGVVSPAGKPCGVRAPCICPNGRSVKEELLKPRPRFDAHRFVATVTIRMECSSHVMSGDEVRRLLDRNTRSFANAAIFLGMTDLEDHEHEVEVEIEEVEAS